NGNGWPRQELACLSSFAYETTQKLHPCGHVGKTVVAAFALDHEPAAILNLFEYTEVAHPVDVAVSQWYLLGSPAGSGLAGLLGMAVDDAAVQNPGTLVRIEATEEQVGRVEVDTQPAGIQAVKKGA